MPQLRDTADDIILNRDMDHPAQVENEQAFLRMQEGPNPNPNSNPAPNPSPTPNPSPNPNPNPNQEGAAGQASRAANEKFFDARLNKDATRTGVPPELFSEPPGRLRGTVVYAPEEAVAGRNTAARHAKSLEGAAGVTRARARVTVAVAVTVTVRVSLG